MLRKHEVLQAITGPGALLIIRLDSADEAIAVARAAVAGGIRALEVTLSVPDAFDVIHTLSTEFADDGVAVGAGTVLDEQAAFTAISAGARLLVSPNLNPNTVSYTHLTLPTKRIV